MSEFYNRFLECTAVCTDSRKAIEGGLYFSLKGEHFNGNAFAKQALASGCKYAVVDEKEFAVNESYILVNDALKALQELSNFHRIQFDIPIIGITGSNGKTTTKELMHAILSKKYDVLATRGNLNNHIGVPLTLLSLKENHEIAIVEMGANHINEIAFLCELAEPTFGMITNIGKAHIGEFGGWQNIVKGKGEMYDFIKESGALAFVNQRDYLLMSMSEGFRRFTYGSEESDLPGEVLSSDDVLKLKIRETEIQTNLFGDYNFSNIMAAAAIGTYFKIELDQIKAAIESYVPENNRSQILKTDKNKLILDAYNANPTSMKAAIDNFEKIANGNAYVILGDMLELGEETGQAHQEIIHSIKTKKLKGILVGEIFCEVNQSEIPAYKNVEEVIASGVLKSKENATILLKGSRVIGLEKLVEQL